MSLVLNGGVDGTGSTQYAYINSAIVSALPATVSFWFKAGTNASASGQLVNWVDKDATAGITRMGCSTSRSTGIVLVRGIITRLTTASSSGSVTNADYAISVTNITTGATTRVAVADASGFAAGEYVRLEGAFAGITGITSGREWRISSIADNTLTLALSTSGTWSEGQSATVKWSAWQPEKWNLGVASFTLPDNGTRHIRGGFLGNTAATIRESYSGTSGQQSADVFPSVDRLSIGALAQATVSDYWRGEIAHVAVWESFPTLAQAEELLTLAPNLVSWGAPTAYWPLLSDETDSIGSADLTLVGTPSITSDGPSITLSGGGGGSGYLPTIMRAQPTNLFGF
jgi:hypothetical protein